MKDGRFLLAFSISGWSVNGPAGARRSFITGSIAKFEFGLRVQSYYGSAMEGVLLNFVCLKGSWVI